MYLLTDNIDDDVKLKLVELGQACSYLNMPHMVINGAVLVTVKEILGHKTMAMTLPYAHLSSSY